MYIHICKGMCIYVCAYIYIYLYMYMYVCVYIYIYIYIGRVAELPCADREQSRA